MQDDPDLPIRFAAFQALERLVAVHGDVLPFSVLQQGFLFQGERVFFMSKAQGIFKPQRMRSALSLRSITHVRQGRLSRYADDRTEQGFVYELQGGPLDSASNRALLEAFRLRTPVIYLQSIAQGRYAAVWPTFIVSVDLEARTCRVEADEGTAVRRQVEGILDKDAAFRRQYATYQAQRRLHQADFRHRVLHAYDCRCAVCGLPEQSLIDAAHIVPDSEELGEPVVPNGLALCRLHHGAFDAQLLGVRPDRRIVIADQLLKMTDGPTLRHGLQGFHDKEMRSPRDDLSRPGALYLATRWRHFEEANRDRASALLVV